MTTETVHLLVLDTLADWEPGYAVAHINSPAYQGQPGRFRVQTIGPSRDPITTMGGLRILPDFALDAVRPEDSRLLILPGGGGWDSDVGRRAVELARSFLTKGVPVAAICGATEALAKGGLLDERAHTSNAREYLAATGYKGGASYRDEPVVSDRGLITANSTAPLEFARAIFEEISLYEPAVLRAWYALFKTGKAEHYFELMQAANPGK